MKGAIDKFQLSNGLTVLLENIPHRTSATVGLFLPIGSRFETKQESGFSHFVEHMLFKGTKRRNYAEISRTIDRLGGYLNASTSKELTDFYVSLSGRHLPIALDVLADMFYDSLFSPAEFESEKNVIIEELKMSEDQPDDFLVDLFYRTQIGDTPLGRPVGGSPAGIARAKRDDLYNYYITQYGPEGAVLSLAGALYASNTDKKKLIAAISQSFDRNDHALRGKVGFQRAEAANAAAAQPHTLRAKVHKHHTKKLEQVNFVLSLPGEQSALEQPADIAVLTHYLGGTMSSRLFIELREKKGLCYSVSTFHSQFLHEGVWGIFCATSPSKYAAAIETAIGEVKELVSGIDAGDIEESKSGLKGSIELSMESASRRASYNARMQLYYGVRHDWQEYLAAIDRVTPATFLQALRRLWKNTAPSVTSLGPKLPVAAAKRVQKLIKEPLFAS